MQLIAEAFNLPAVRQHDLLHHGQTETGAVLIGGKVGFENVLPLFHRHAWAVVANLEERFLRPAPI